MQDRHIMFTIKHTCVGGVAFVLISFAAQPSNAADRATIAQLSKLVADAGNLWDNPGTNYSRISACVIRPGTISRAELLNRLTNMCGKVEIAQDKAALNYLIGETHYWGSLAELQRTKDRTTVRGVGDLAVSAYLAAFAIITKAEPDRAASQLRRAIVVRLNSLLATTLGGANLSSDLKQQVVMCYIDKLSPDEEASKAWPVSQRGRAYSNLGIQTRLADKLPTIMPTNFFSICEAMNSALAAGATNQALQFATCLEEKYATELAARPPSLREVFEVYRVCKDSRGFACLKTLAITEPKAWLAMYELAIRINRCPDKEQRHSYIDEYFKACASKGGMTINSYRSALDTLMANDDFALAVQVADKAVTDGRFGPSTQRAFVWRIKALAHEKSGERTQAAEAYRTGMAEMVAKGSEEQKERFQRGMSIVQEQAVTVGGEK